MSSHGLFNYYIFILSSPSFAASSPVEICFLVCVVCVERNDCTFAAAVTGGGGGGLPCFYFSSFPTWQPVQKLTNNAPKRTSFPSLLIFLLFFLFSLLLFFAPNSFRTTTTTTDSWRAPHHSQRVHKGSHSIGCYSGSSYSMVCRLLCTKGSRAEGSRQPRSLKK